MGSIIANVDIFTYFAKNVKFIYTKNRAIRITFLVFLCNPGSYNDLWLIVVDGFIGIHFDDIRGRGGRSLAAISGVVWI